MIFAIVLTCAGILGEGWLRAHAPRVMPILFVLAAISLLLGMLTIFSKDEEIAVLASALPSTSIGRDNSGTQTGRDNTGSITNISAGVYNEAPYLREPAKVNGHAAQPIFSWGFCNARVTYSSGRFVFSEEGSRCIAIEVTNLPPREPGSIYGNPQSVLAHVTLSYSWTRQSIACAYWVGKHENQIELQSGKSNYILIALVSDSPMLKVFDNREAYPPSTLDWDFSPISVAYNDPEPQLFPWVDGLKIE